MGVGLSSDQPVEVVKRFVTGNPDDDLVELRQLKFV